MLKTKISLLLLMLSTIIVTSCGGGQNKIDEIKSKTTKAPVDPMANWETNNGIGPIKAFSLPSEIDEALVGEGKQLFEAKCTACHKTDKKFIGPSPKDILTRRNPAWVMNMILNPDEMLQKDPIAKQLLIEANGAPMANQNLSEAEARAILEYFRSL